MTKNKCSNCGEETTGSTPVTTLGENYQQNDALCQKCVLDLINFVTNPENFDEE